MSTYDIWERLSSRPEVLSVALVGFLAVGDPMLIEACVEVIGIERNCGYPGP